VYPQRRGKAQGSYSAPAVKVALRAAIGGRFIAREDISAFAKTLLPAYIAAMCRVRKKSSGQSKTGQGTHETI